MIRHAFFNSSTMSYDSFVPQNSGQEKQFRFAPSFFLISFSSSSLRRGLYFAYLMEVVMATVSAEIEDVTLLGVTSTGGDAWWPLLGGVEGGEVALETPPCSRSSKPSDSSSGMFASRMCAGGLGVSLDQRF